MGLFSSEKKTNREEILERIKNSQSKKESFIEWLESYHIFLKKTDNWDKIIKEVNIKRQPTNTDLGDYLKDVKKSLREKEKTKKKVKKTTKEIGGEFEKKVARYVKQKFPVEHVKSNIQVNGNEAKRPYEIDIHAYKKGVFSESSFMIECKNRKSNIKRTDIFKLKSSADDIKKAYENGKGNIYFDKLAIFSTSDFDVDAISMAEKDDIACIKYENGKYDLKNNVSWINR